MKRQASAHWEGGLENGKGRITTDSGVLLQTQYSHATRYGDELGTNPEELLAAAHAACFAMGLAAELAKLKISPVRIHASATATLSNQAGRQAITQLSLDVNARIPGADPLDFERALSNAMETWPLSQLLKGKFTVRAELNAW